MTPAMYAVMGLVTEAAMKSAASSSADPPISPIIMIACVSSSRSNSRRQSMKSVPGTGSPPIPTQLDTPMPFCFSSSDEAPAALCGTVFPPLSKYARASSSE